MTRWELAGRIAIAAATLLILTAFIWTVTHTGMWHP